MPVALARPIDRKTPTLQVFQAVVASPGDPGLRPWRLAAETAGLGVDDDANQSSPVMPERVVGHEYQLSFVTIAPYLQYGDLVCRFIQSKCHGPRDPLFGCKMHPMCDSAGQWPYEGAHPLDSHAEFQLREWRTRRRQSVGISLFEGHSLGLRRGLGRRVRTACHRGAGAQK